MPTLKSSISSLLLPLVAVSLCLCGSTPTQSAEKTLLLIGQKPDGHPAGTHEYLAAQRIVAQLLKDVPGLKTEIVEANEPWSEGPERLANVDGAFLFVSEGAKWLSADPRRYEAFTQLAQRKGGLTAIHWGIGTKDAKNIEPYTRLLGASHGGPDRKYTFFETIDVSFANDHPVTSGLAPLTVGEEFYYQLKTADAAAGRITPLVTIATADGRQTVGWAFDRTDGGRSFGFTGLHFHKNWQRPEYRRLIAQGILWTMNIAPPKDWKLDVPDELLK
jgi:hypothetical protein